MIAESSSVTTVETAFNVEIEEQSDVQILVTKDKILFDHINPAMNHELTSNKQAAPGNQVYLEIGQQMTIDGTSEPGRMARLTEDALEALLA